MDTMGNAEWEALPARKKRGSAEKTADQVQVATTLDAMNPAQWEALPARSKKAGVTKNDSIDNVENLPGPVAGRMKVQKLQQIMDNIEARRQVTHNISTLASKDGCAGQYYEYLDHTADVQCHAWGASMKEAFQNMAPCMMNYMTDLTLVEEDPEETLTMTIEGHDLQSLLYNFMNEMLFKFSSDCFCTVRADITRFDEEKFAVDVTLFGDIYDPNKHSSGTEIKAITYSNMQIHNTPEKVDLYVIVDI